MDIAYHLHIPPRQQDTLTRVEWAEAVAAIDKIRADSKKEG